MKLNQHYLPQPSSHLRRSDPPTSYLPITIFFSVCDITIHHTLPLYLLPLQILLLRLLALYLYLSTLHAQHICSNLYALLPPIHDSVLEQMSFKK
jgi:hypothetical protein